MKFIQENSIQESKPISDSHEVLKGWANVAKNFHQENILGTWKLEQLLKMEEDFNKTLAINDSARFHLLYNFFHAQIITNIFVDDQKFISEDALRIDQSIAQLRAARRAHMISACLIRFSEIRFGPPSKKKKGPKHDAHVKTAALQKVPAPYQRKYPNDPELLLGLGRGKEYQIEIQHSVKTGGFCKCVNLTHLETKRAIPLSKVLNIRMQYNTSGAYDLYIEVMK